MAYKNISTNIFKRTKKDISKDKNLLTSSFMQNFIGFIMLFSKKFWHNIFSYLIPTLHTQCSHV